MTDPGRDEMVRALRVLSVPGGVVELRAIAEDGIHSGYFDDPDLLAASAATLDFSSVHGVYVTLNEVSSALLARRANRLKMRLSRKDATTSDADIVRRRWFPIDIDPVRPSGVSSTAEEHERAMNKADEVAAWLANQGFPEPVRGDSGNGAHLLYRIDLPNDDASRVLVQQCLSVLSALFSDASCTIDNAVYNAARIWKLYGTVSRKGDYTGMRPHRRSHLVSVPEQVGVVPGETLGRLAGLIPSTWREVSSEQSGDPGSPRSRTKVSQEGKIPIVLASWLREHGIRVRAEKPWHGGRLFLLEECPFSTAHKDGAFAIQFANGAVFAGCHHASCGGAKQRWKDLRAMHEKKHAGRVREVSSAPSQASLTLESSPEPAPEEEAKERALDVLRHGDPAAFILSTFSHCHVGDETVAACYLASTLSSSVRNSKGLHVCPTGDSGKGKSDSASAFLRLLPDEARMQGSISSKALFYHSLSPGTVIIFDDFAMHEDLREVLKNSTSDFQHSLRHFTLNANRQPVVLMLPPRCVWWVLSVDNPGDDQVLSRMLNPWIDDSEQQDERVRDHIFSLARLAPGTLQEHPDVAVCREIFAAIREHLFSVRIPFSDRIRMDSIRNRRNPAILLDLIRSYAVLRFLQREQEILPDGSIGIDATEEDFADAARLFSALDTTSGSQTSKLLKNEKLLLDSVLAMKAEEFTVKDVQEWMGMSAVAVRRVLHGRRDREGDAGGLLSKCPAISVIETTTTEGNLENATRRREYHYLFHFELYRRWVRRNGVWLAPEETGDSSSGDGDGPSDLTKAQTLDSLGSEDLTGPHSHDSSGSQVQDPSGSRSPDPTSSKVHDLAESRSLDPSSPRAHDPIESQDPNPSSSQIQDPTGSQWVTVGTRSGIQSQTATDAPIVNPENNTKNNSNDRTKGSHNPESAACTSEKTERPISPPPHSCSSGDPGSRPEISTQTCESVETSPHHGNPTIPDTIPNAGPVGSWDPGRERDYTALPYECPEPCHVCGKAPTSSVRRVISEDPGGTLVYLCYQCLKDIREREKTDRRRSRAHDCSPRTVPPLPGLLDHRDFLRSEVAIGKCDLCSRREAEYRNSVTLTKCCGECYGRLVREWNMAQGVG